MPPSCVSYHSIYTPLKSLPETFCSLCRHQCKRKYPAISSESFKKNIHIYGMFPIIPYMLSIIKYQKEFFFMQYAPLFPISLFFRCLKRLESLSLYHCSFLISVFGILQSNPQNQFIRVPMQSHLSIFQTYFSNKPPRLLSYFDRSFFRLSHGSKIQCRSCQNTIHFLGGRTIPAIFCKQCQPHVFILLYLYTLSTQATMQPGFPFSHHFI